MLLSSQRSTSTTRPTSTCSVRFSHSRRVCRQRNASQQGHPQPVDAVSAASAGAAAVATDSAVVRPISNQPSPLEPHTGYVPAEADLAKVPISFRPLLDSIVAAYSAACGSRLVGVYLRGSIPRGLFLPGISDVDTFAVVLPVTTVTAATVHSSSSGSGGSSTSSSDGEYGSSGSSSSSEASLHDLQQAVKRLSHPAVQTHQHLGYTKVEIKVLQVDPNSPAAAALATLLQQHTPSPHTTYASASTHHSSSSSRAVQPLRPSMSASIPYAFELKTAAVCLSGLDLGQLLHPSAALPPQFEVLPGLESSVEDARAAAEGAAAAVAEAIAAAAGGRSGDAEMPALDKAIPAAAPAAAAAAAAAAAVSDNVEVQVRATKWALKRLLRSAFELVQDRSGCYTRDLFWCCHYAKQHIPQLQQQLNWAHTPQQQKQEQQWHEQLDAALQLYVNLQSNLLLYQQAAAAAAHPRNGQQQQQQGQRLHAASGGQGTTAAAAVEGHQQQLQDLVTSSWQLVDVLLPKLDTLFLKAMLMEEPGWLTKHAAAPIPASLPPEQQRSDPSSSSSSSSGGGSSGGAMLPQQREQGGVVGQQSPWLFAGKALKALQDMLSPTAAAAAAAAAAAGGGRVTQVLGALPPDVQVPVVGRVQEFDWQQQQARAAGAAAVREILCPNNTTITAGNGSGCSCNSSSSRSSSNGAGQGPAVAGFELLGCWPQPMLLRGAAASWPCVADRWDLEWLAQQGIQGKVRVAPSLQFPFVEPQLLDILIKLRGVQAAPSITADMSAREFVQRLQPGCAMQPIAYSPSECYYWQADLPQHLRQQKELDSLLRSISGCGPQAAGQVLQQQQQQQNTTAEGQVEITQQPRLWVSPAGAVSPLHYDKSHSFLVQVTGVKRMLFFSLDQLYRLYCYPDTHILRRRSRVNLAAPVFETFPLFAEAAALEVVLQPGDVVCFPSFWSHYTESLGQGPAPGQSSVTTGGHFAEINNPAGCSMSITFRCQAADWA